MAEKRKILLDTDMGVDDALALMLAMRSPELEVVAITTVAGNVEVELCTRNVGLVLDRLNEDGPVGYPPVFQGAAQPLAIPLLTAPEVHGADGVGNTAAFYPPPSHPPQSGEAVAAIIELSHRYGQELTIVAIGPLTNLALALQRDPEALAGVREIIVMGGAIATYGNTTRVAEFNFYVDPEAAAQVFAAQLPLTLMPLDVTEQVLVTRSQLLELEALHPSPLANFIPRLTKYYMAYHLETEGFEGGFLHDPLAIAAAIQPDLFTAVSVPVHVETRGEWTRGMSVVDLRERMIPASPGKTRVATGVDEAGFMALLIKRLWGPVPLSSHSPGS